MKRIIFLSDFLFHSPDREASYHRWIMDLLEPAVKSVIGKPIIDFVNLTNDHGERFNRDYFYELSDINNVTDGYYSYDMKKINKKSWKYFFSFINTEDFILGVELGIDLRQVLTNNKIIFINFWFHSFHLFDDMFLMLNTNNMELYSRIKKYQIPTAKFELYTTIVTKLLKEQAQKVAIDNNSCLFIGQTFQDKSVEKSGVFLNISHFGKRLDQLSKEYSTIYYIPHPAVAKERNVEIESFIKEHPYIKKLENIPTYVLLSSSKVEKVIGISSSVLYEAQFFNKEIEYLYQPLFDIDGSFGLNTFISVYNDYLNPAFWCEILKDFFRINYNRKDDILFDKRISVFRSVANSYHGYRWLDPYMKMVDKTNGLNTQIKNLANYVNESTKKINNLETEVCRLASEKSSLCIYRKLKKGNVVIRYLFGIPIFKRIKSEHYKKIYILGIPVCSIEK